MIKKFWFEIFIDQGEELGTMTIAQAETFTEAIVEWKQAVNSNVFEKNVPVMIDMWMEVDGSPIQMGYISLN